MLKELRCLVKIWQEFRDCAATVSLLLQVSRKTSKPSHWLTVDIPSRRKMERTIQARYTHRYPSEKLRPKQPINSSLDTTVDFADLQLSQVVWQRQETLAQTKKRETYEDWKVYLELLLSKDEQTFLLTGTGFDMPMQIMRFVNTCKNAPNFQEAKEKAMNELRLDMRGYLWEFLEKQPVLPQELILTTDGKLVAPNYSDAPLKEVTNDKERNGAIKEAVKTLETLTASADKETIFVVASPAGWSGLEDEDGNPLVFPEAQVYAYLVTEGGEGRKINGVTLRTSLSLQKIEKLQEELSGGEFQIPKGNKKQRIRKLSAFVSQTGLKSFEQVVDKMQQIAGDKVAKRDENHNPVHFFADLRQAVKTQPKINQEIAEILCNFEDFVEKNIYDLSDESIRKLVIKMGKTILDMSISLSKKQNEEKLTPLSKPKIKDNTSRVVYQRRATMSEAERYHRALWERQQEDEGCLATLTAANIRMIETPFGPRLVVSLTQKDKYGPLTFSCPYCDKTNEREYNQLLTNCKHCGENVRCG